MPLKGRRISLCSLKELFVSDDEIHGVRENDEIRTRHGPLALLHHCLNGLD